MGWWAVDSARGQQPYLVCSPLVVTLGGFPSTIRDGEAVLSQFGPYRLLRRLAVGGMGEIYLAKLEREAGFEKIMVIKRILPSLSGDPAFVSMFNREACIAAQLFHQNIVQIFDYGQHDRSYFIAMEYVHGRDLRTLIEAAGAKERVLPVPVTLAIVTAACSALDYAHRRKGLDGNPLHVVHRDVSPQNILVSHEGAVKLTDFGLAQRLDIDSVRDGQIQGKFAYMSPEQTFGDPLDQRSDIFSLGIVLYEMLCGQRPFRSKDLTTLMMAIRKGHFVPPSEVNPALPVSLDEIMARALAVEPDDRYAEARDLAAALNDVARGEGLVANAMEIGAVLDRYFPDDGVQTMLRDPEPTARVARESTQTAASPILQNTQASGHPISGAHRPVRRGTAPAIAPITSGSPDASEDIAAVETQPAVARAMGVAGVEYTMPGLQAISSLQTPVLSRPDAGDARAPGVVTAPVGESGGEAGAPSAQQGALTTAEVERAALREEFGEPASEATTDDASAARLEARSPDLNPVSVAMGAGVPSDSQPPAPIVPLGAEQSRDRGSALRLGALAVVLLGVGIFAGVFFDRESLGGGGDWTLELEAEPTGAEVYINGRRQGTTPVKADVRGGAPVKIEFRHQGYKPIVKTLDLGRGGGNMAVEERLEPEQVTGHVIVSAEMIEGLTIKLDDGTSLVPEQPGRYSFHRPPGPVTVYAIAEGYKPVERKLTVGTRSTIHTDIKLEPLPLVIKVRASQRRAQGKATIRGPRVLTTCELPCEYTAPMPGKVDVSVAFEGQSGRPWRSSQVGKPGQSLIFVAPAPVDPSGPANRDLTPRINATATVDGKPRGLIGAKLDERPSGSNTLRLDDGRVVTMRYKYIKGGDKVNITIGASPFSSVVIDGVGMGNTPVSHTIGPGKHTVQLGGLGASIAIKFTPGSR